MRYLFVKRDKNNRYIIILDKKDLSVYICCHSGKYEIYRCRSCLLGNSSCSMEIGESVCDRIIVDTGMEISMVAEIIKFSLFIKSFLKVA